MILAVILFFVGITVLYYGAEFLVEGSSRFAISFGIRPLVIGMTIVALATSMPEMMVTLLASVKGSSDLAAGNIIGSNIANVGLILGVAAVFQPVSVTRKTVLCEIPIMVGASVLLWLCALDGVISAGDGLLMVASLGAFLLYCLKNARNEEGETEIPEGMVRREKGHRKKDMLYILLGIIGLAAGAELMVRSGVFIGRSLGISEMVIGLSVIALGTSLPELAASSVSAWRGESDLSVGNVIGSNIFNIFFVLGVCALIRPLPIQAAVLRFELPVMILFSMALIPLMYRGLVLGRREGMFLLAAYLLFIWRLFW